MKYAKTLEIINREVNSYKFFPTDYFKGLRIIAAYNNGLIILSDAIKEITKLSLNRI